MTPEKEKQRNLDNTFHSEELKRLMNKFGNLVLHVSGEAKIDFNTRVTGWLPMIKLVYSGDIGCMTPYSGYDVCARDNAIDFLLDLDTCPHLNSSAFDKYVPTPEEWKTWILKVKADLDDYLTEGIVMKRYNFSLSKEVDGVNVVICTLTLEPICNEFVVGEMTAAKHNEFLGELDDFDQPGLKFTVATIGGKDIEIQTDDLCHFRGKQYLPRKGDYLLRDVERKLYIVLPQEDYSIH